MYTQEKVYRSLIYHVAQLVPSGILVVEGASYGVNFDDPTGQSPSVAVELNDTRDEDIELGGMGTTYDITITLNAKSRVQRDALKTVLRAGLLQNPMRVYSTFSGTSLVPASGAVTERIGEVGQIVMRDMPNFESDRERFFWVSVLVSELTILGY